MSALGRRPYVPVWRRPFVAAEDRRRLASPADPLSRRFRQLRDRALLADPAERQRRFDWLRLRATDPEAAQLARLVALAAVPLDQTRPETDDREPPDGWSANAAPDEPQYGPPTTAAAARPLGSPLALLRASAGGEEILVVTRAGKPVLPWDAPRVLTSYSPRTVNETVNALMAAAPMPNALRAGFGRRPSRARKFDGHARGVQIQWSEAEHRYDVLTASGLRLDGWSVDPDLRPVLLPLTSEGGPVTRELTRRGLDASAPPELENAGGLMERAKMLVQLVNHGATELAGMFRSHDEAASASTAVTALREFANRPQPAPVVHVHVPEQPAPVIHVAPSPPAEPPVVHVHVPDAKRRAVRVEYDEQGNKRYVLEDEPEEA